MIVPIRLTGRNRQPKIWEARGLLRWLVLLGLSFCLLVMIFPLRLLSFLLIKVSKKLCDFIFIQLLIIVLYQLLISNPEPFVLILRAIAPSSIFMFSFFGLPTTTSVQHVDREVVSWPYAAAAVFS